MTTQPLVTVVLPVHNGEDFVGQAVDSVLGQTYPSVELIVIDDASTDGSARIIRASRGPVRYIHQERTGAAEARNHGIRIARGDLVGFIDADDLWVPRKLEVQIQFLVNHPEVEFCVGKVRHFLEPGRTIPRGFKTELLERDVIGRLFGTMLARPSAFGRVGLFNNELSIAHDVEWFVRAEERNVSMGVVDEVVMRKRVHEDNISNRAATNSAQLLSLFRKSIKRRTAHAD